MADKPVTREEKYLAYLTGDYKGELPKPITRKEKYLYELCLKGIGGEISPEEIKAAVNEYLEKNPVKPGATTEQAQQIEQNKTNIASLKEDLATIENSVFDNYVMVQNLCTKEMLNTSSFPLKNGKLNITNLQNGAFNFSGIESTNYPNLVFKLPSKKKHTYLFALDIKENTDNACSVNVIARYDGTNVSLKRTIILGNGNITSSEYADITKRVAVLVEYNDETNVSDNIDFVISFDLTKSGKKVDVSISNIIICDVTDLKTDERIAIAEYGYFNIYKKYRDIVADNLSENGFNIIYDKAKRRFLESCSDDFIRIFRKVCVVGDSLSSGEIVMNDDGDTKYIDKYDYSWLSTIAKKINATAMHYSKGGLTTSAWLNDDGGYKSKLLSDDASNCYFIALGTNDLNNSVQVGNVNDSEEAGTFIGNYKKIINIIKSKAPNAAIMCVSLYINSDTYNNAIKSVTNLYDMCYFVDYASNSDIYTNDAEWANMGHFTTLGYVRVADVIYDLVNKIINENKNDFKFFSVSN